MEPPVVVGRIAGASGRTCRTPPTPPTCDRHLRGQVTLPVVTDPGDALDSPNWTRSLHFAPGSWAPQRPLSPRPRDGIWLAPQPDPLHTDDPWGRGWGDGPGE